MERAETEVEAAHGYVICIRAILGCACKACEAGEVVTAHRCYPILFKPNMLCTLGTHSHTGPAQRGTTSELASSRNTHGAT